MVYPILVSFAGNDAYLPSNGSANLTINKIPTTLVILSPDQAPVGSVDVQARLLANGLTPPVPYGQVIAFTATSGTQVVLGSGTTDLAGLTTATLYPLLRRTYVLSDFSPATTTTSRAWPPPGPSP